MIIEHIADSAVSGHGILWPSLTLIVLGIIFAYDSRINRFVRAFVCCTTIIIGVLGLFECIVSSFKIPSDRKELPVTEIRTYPIEYREETNKLYVFKNGSYSELSHFSREYATPSDTLYQYYFLTTGGALYWLKSYYYTINKNPDAVLPDTPVFEKNEKVILKMNSDGKLTTKGDTTEKQNPLPLSD